MKNDSRFDRGTDRYPLIWIGLAVLTVAYPFLTIAHVFRPIEIFGKNIYISMPALFFLMSALYIAFKQHGDVVHLKPFLYFVPCMVLGSLIFLLRSVLYDESVNILYMRFVIMLPLFIFVISNVVRSAARREWAAALLLTAVVTQAIIGIVHQHFFSNINIQPGVDTDNPFELHYEAVRTREAGTLLSANLSSRVCLSWRQGLDTKL
jgi:hypothetical protein